MPKAGTTRREFLAQSAAAVALLADASAWGEAKRSSREPLQPAALNSARAGGELGIRTGLNFTRLQSDIYRPPLLWRQTNWQSWPGDFEGRALLGVTLLSQVTADEPSYFPAMVADYRKQVNPQGYFGPRLDVHAINEQQLSGHGWFLRGLCEYFLWRRDPQTLDQIRAVVKNLALPLRGKYAAYPIDPALRAQAVAPSAPGAVNGHLDNRHGDWVVSSDTGCAFIFLDGLTQAWVVLQAAGDPMAAPLKELIDEAAARFTQVDLLAIKAQTHASLTAMRALLRMHEQTHDPALLRTVQDRYALYRATAMTAHYANTNWFGRPQTWTEPCAIIDSFMVATMLWQHTGRAAYLEDAHRIWLNGVSRGLRNHGGFGTDTCAGFGTPWLRVRSYEAYFCCTMRGGEGHARAAQYLYFTRPGELTVPFFAESDATVDLGDGPLRLRQTTSYPYEGTVRIEVVSAARTHRPVKLRLFAPQWCSAQTVSLDGKPLAVTRTNGFLETTIQPRAGSVIVLDQHLSVGPGEPVNPAGLPGYFTVEAGPLLLGYTGATDPARGLKAPNPQEIHLPHSQKLEPTGRAGQFRAGGVLLAPIRDLYAVELGPRDPCARQILFRET